LSIKLRVWPLDELWTKFLTICVMLQMNINDPRFSAIYDNPLYNVDQSAPEFKRSRTMEAILEEKVKRRTMSERDS